MKLFKKAATLCAVLLLTLGAGAAIAACEHGTDPSDATSSSGSEQNSADTFNGKTVAETYEAILTKLKENASNAEQLAEFSMTVTTADSMGVTVPLSLHTKRDGDNTYRKLVTALDTVTLESELYYADGILYENTNGEKLKQAMSLADFQTYVDYDPENPVLPLYELSADKFDGIAFERKDDGASFAIGLTAEELTGNGMLNDLLALTGMTISDVEYVVYVDGNSDFVSADLELKAALMDGEEILANYVYKGEITVTNLGTTTVSAPEDADAYDNANAEQIYEIRVKTVGDYPFRDVNVVLFDGETRIASKRTNNNGSAKFRDVEPGNYDIVVENMPAGYALASDEPYVTSPVAGTTVTVELTPTGVLSGPAPTGTFYSLGDVMYDFEVTNSDGGKFVLSERLKEKDMVLINFWATWCGPCKSEFPAMNNAYLSYQDKIDIIAISTTDTNAQVSAFRSTAGINFEMAANGSITNMFGTSAIPVSIIVDRYGVVAYMHTGSMTATSQFTALFDQFVGDNYTPKVLGSAIVDDEDTETDGSYVPPTTEVLAQTPDLDLVNELIGGPKSGFELRWEEGDDADYAWPWLIENDYIYAPNKNAHPSFATIYFDFHAEANKALCFDYMLDTELDADHLYVIVDGAPIHKLSGMSNGWKTCYAYVFETGMEGEHTMALTYLKDELDSAEDIVRIRNLRFEDLSSINDDPEVDANVFRYAATVENTDANATTQFKNYIIPVFNEEDGYYHVHSADGPLLFANMMYASPWNQTSVWLLSYYNYFIHEGYSYKAEIEQYAWAANNNLTGTYGYTPVTKELRDYLELMTECVTFGKLWDGAWHKDEWLELCVYYDHYGATPQMEDPMKTITFHAAVELTVTEDANATGDGIVKNPINVPFAMTPRGFKYKFTTAKSGVYNVYSLGEADTFCFLVAGDQTTFLGTYNDVFISKFDPSSGEASGDPNFNFHYYFNAGETYYLLCTTFLDQTAIYDVVIQYVGETYTSLEACATGPLSFNEVTGILYLPGAPEYVFDPETEYDLNGDGKTDGKGVYRILNDDGSMGSVIYVDMIRPTHLFNYNSLYQIASAALEEVVQKDENGNTLLDDNGDPVYGPAYQSENRAFYLVDENGEGTDYSEWIETLGFYSKRISGELQGYLPVTQELFEFLTKMTDKYEGVYNSWLLLCYYYKTLS